MGSLEQLIATAMMTPLDNVPSPSDPACIMGLPVNIVGLSGGGKTARMNAAARMLEMPLWGILVATKLPEEIGSMPIMGPEGLTMECPSPQVRKAMNAGRGILFFDELSTARPSTQAACLGAFSERRFGDQLLPPKIRIAAAMNPTEYAAGGYAIEAPLANRMMWIKYDMPSTAEWIDWIRGEEKADVKPIAQAERLVIDNWNEHWSTLRGRLVGFITAFPTYRHQQPLPNDPASGGPWPSPRMWTWAARALATRRCLGTPETLDAQIVGGCVGEPIVPEWLEWNAKADMPTALEMLTNGWVPDARRMDKVHGSLVTLETWFKEVPPGEGLAYAARAWGLVDAVIKAGMPDLAVRPASVLVSRDLGHNAKDAGVKAAAKPVILWLGKKGYSKFANLVT